MFGSFASGPVGYAPLHPTYGPAVGDSLVEYKVGPRAYDGGVHNSPFSEGRIKDPFSAPGPFHPFMFMRPRRRRLNVLSIVQVMALPFVLFAMTMYLFGFWVHNNAAEWCWFFVVFCMLLSMVFLYKAFKVYRQWRFDRWNVPWYLLNDDDTWFLYLGTTVFISCILGLVVGQAIYGSYTQSYYTLSLLHKYDSVDPISAGKAYLDAGAVNFAEKSYVDVTHAVGYKDGVVYCVAPIKLGTESVANFDFWAVGTDCCTGFPGNFNCFEDRSDTSAHGGLRIVDDSEIPFYKLAVMQADGEFKENAEFLKDGRLNSPNPIFFTWMKDPTKKVLSMWRDAVWTYLTSLAVFLFFEVAIVCTLSYMYWKNRLWG